MKLNIIKVTQKDVDAFNQASYFDPNARFVNINPMPINANHGSGLKQKNNVDDVIFDPNDGSFFKIKR